MNKEQKDGWETPRLIVLTRNKPEEAVLTTCKSGTSGPATSGQGWGMCASMCSECFNVGDS